MEAEYKEEKDVGIIILNRPDKKNSISMEMSECFEKIIDNDLKDNGRVKVVIITGAGKFFCAGADVSEFQKLNNPTYLERFLESGRYFMNGLSKIPQFVIAALNGPTFGGGLEIALAADYIIAQDSNEGSIGQLEIRFGLIPGAGGTQRLPLRTGMGVAKKLIMSGEVITPKQALQYRIVDELSDNPLQRALELSKAYSDKDLVSMGMAKDAIQSHQSGAYEKEKGYFIECLRRPETQARIEGFLSKSNK